jgi:cytidine deaminase
MKTRINDKMTTTLLTAAKKAMKQAYAPYSKYKVGAALLCKDGSIYSGCNVENASYGLTVCAERTAFIKAISAGKRKFTAIAITADGKKAAPYPCGACRQFMAEFCEPSFTVIVSSAKGKTSMFWLSDLLPTPFH